MTIIPNRRWFQFRLQTLLILMAVVAAPLAWVARERRQSYVEQQLAEELQRQKFHHLVVRGRYDSNQLALESKPQGWWRDLAARVLGQRINKLQPGTNDFDDLSPLAGLTNLQWLSVNSCKVSDVRPIAGLTTLEVLNLRSTRVEDLSPLVGLKNLQWLRIQFTPVKDLTPLAGLTGLMKLQMEGSQVSDLSPLAGLTNLDWLDASKTRVEDLSPLAGLKNLTHLYLNNTPVSDLTPLAGLKKLAELKVKQTHVSKKQLDSLQQALPNCQIEHDPFP